MSFYQHFFLQNFFFVCVAFNIEANLKNKNLQAKEGVQESGTPCRRPAVLCHYFIYRRRARIPRDAVIHE